MINSSIRRVGIPGTRTVHWGEHLCAFFYTKTDLLNLIVPYIKAGLEDNEFCLWITEEHMEQEALAALERVLPDAPQYVSRKQLEILQASQWYLTGGVFDAAKSFTNWAARGRAAEANGFVGARTTGNPFWLDSEEDWHQFLTYEQAVHQAIETQRAAPGAGAVYVFTRTAGVWSQQAYIKASNTDAGDRFGHDLQIDGETLAVGARLEASAASGVNADQTDNSAPSAGAVYVFTRTGGVWSQQAYLKASNAGANRNFGGSVSIEGDILAVGSRLEDSDATGIDGNQGNSNAPDSGAVYLFKRTAGVWTQTHYLKASNANGGDEFGDSVALSGGTLAVAAWLEASNATGVNGNQADNSAPMSGAVYIFGEQ